MQTTHKFAITPIAAAVTAALYPGAQAVAQEDQSGAVLEEIIVTSRKRSESVQDIPASIQALTEDDLRRMGANGIEDYSRFVPSVNVVSYSATSYNIVFRGATIDAGGYVAQNPASIYLDEISITSTGSQPGIRMVDIERVEALSGPQGTIYGSDAQAGTMRVITNKPVMNTFETMVDLGVKGGEYSDMSYDGSLVFNIPLVDDKLALRLVGYSGHDGGFIDNVYGHTPDSSAIHGPGFVPSGFGTLDNADYVEENWNEADITGARAALRWEINDSWATTFTAIGQKTEQGADSDYDPFVGDLQVIRYFDDFTDDEFEMYSMVIEGDLGFGQLVSATSYYERNIDSVFDNTAYHHYWAANYCQVYYGLDPAIYYWYYPAPGGGNNVIFWPVYCNAPTVDGDYLSAYDLAEQQKRFTQEFRLSGTSDKLDWLAGLYYEESSNAWQARFAFPSSNSYQDSVSLDYHEWASGYTETYPNAGMHWYSDSHTDWEQTAVFGEVTFHATDRLDLTLGGRYFDRSNTNLYFVEHPETNLLPEYLDENGDPAIPEHKGSEKQFVPKVSISYSIGENGMVYGLWTEGYKPGGTNRSRGEPFFPAHYAPDKLTNWETGYKSNFADGAGRFNATLFYMDWAEYQLEMVDPSNIPCEDIGNPEDDVPGLCGQPWQNVVANAGDAHILGAGLELDYAAGDNVLLGLNGEWLQAETDSTLDLNGDGIIDVEAGNPLPTVPELKMSAWAEYNWDVNSINGFGFARLQWSYTSESNNILEPVNAVDNNDANPQLLNKAYNIGDFRFGFRGDTWEASAYINNITDERAQYTHGSGIFEWAAASIAEDRPHVARRYTNRPRELGLRFMKRWGG